ncbi:zinc finger, CCHC-type containing protein [Tanacetum coccineum]
MSSLCINDKVGDYAKTRLLWSLLVFIRSTVIWERVHDFQLGVESYQQKVNLTAPTITFPGIEKHKMFSIVFKPVYGIIYKNIKKEKRVMRHQEIHKFCDATLKRVLEGLKSYNNDVKHGYVTPSVSNEDKMHFLLSTMSVVYVLTTPMPEDDENDSLEAKYMAEDASSKNFLVSDFTNYKMTKSIPVIEQYNELLYILDFKHTLKHKKEELALVELGSPLRIEESLRMQDSDKLKGNNVFGPLVVNIVKHNNSSKYTDNRGKRKHQVDTKVDPSKNSKLPCWKCGKPEHLKKDCKAVKVGNKDNGSSTNGLVNGSSNKLKGATVHVCKDRCWFKTYKSLNDGSTIHMGNESTTIVHGCGCVDLRFSSGKIVSLLNIANDTVNSAFISTSILNDSILWHARLGHVYFKRMQDMSKDGLIPSFDMDTEKCKTCMLTKINKKPFQNVKRQTEFLELIHSDLCDFHATPSLGNKKYFVTFIDDAFSAIVRLFDPKLKTLGERGIECIFVGYVEHSKDFRFYVIEPNESVSINLIIKLRDAIFDENRFSSVPTPSQRSLINETEDIGVSEVSDGVPSGVIEEADDEVLVHHPKPEPELRRSNKHRTPKLFGPEFQLYLIE